MSDNAAVLPETIPKAGGGRTRGLVAVVASVLAIVIIAAAGIAASKFLFSGGPRPAEVLPDSTFALVTVDLDPSGGQKVEAFKTLRKFPSLKKSTGATSESDLMESILDEALTDTDCKSIDYDRDVKPWVGMRAGVGGVLLGNGKPAPVLALQVKDVEKARAGFAKLAECVGEEHIGWTMTGDYLIASNSTSHAKAIVAAGRKSPLTADAGYQKWTDAAGEPGIASFYIARQAPDVAADAMDSRFSDAGFALELEESDEGSGWSSAAVPGDLPSDFPSDFPGKDPGDSGDMSQELEFDKELEGEIEDEWADEDMGDPFGDTVRKQFKEFHGAAGALRFADGGIELSLASNPQQKGAEGSAGEHVGRLPADTAAVMAVEIPKGGEKAYVERITGSGSGFDLPGLGVMFLPFGMLAAFDDDTSLDMPKDLVTLLGSSFSISVGADAPANLDKVQNPGDLPLGALVKGDADEIKAVVAKIEKRSGYKLSELPATLKESSGHVAVGTTPTYTNQLLDEGSLADELLFRTVIPEADRASSLAFVRVDGKWRDALADQARKHPDEAESFANFDALAAIGASSWTEGDISHGLIKLALK